MSEELAYSYSPDLLAARNPKQYAVVIFLPATLDGIIAPLREKYDPDFKLISSHVSLVFPFQTKRSLDEVASIISQEIVKLGAFQLELDSIGDFYPDFPIIFWQVKQNEHLKKLCLVLHARLDIPLPHKKYCAHVTVAKEISPHRVMLIKEELFPYLPDEKFSPQSVDLIAPVADQNWVSIRTFPITRG
ncbi:MAG: 2'-5' RNA ligase family protein [candidate division Zixibacteria bacterium]|nr:2'-5' RNA ligase family protein [candidate division Zixibacteria bacterium]